MESSFTTIQILLFLGAAQGFFLSIFLLTTRRTNRKANRYLAAIIIIFCLNIVIHTISHRPHSHSIPHHEIVITIIFFLFGPFFYFYTRMLTRKYSPSQKWNYLHFLPFIVCLISCGPVYWATMNQEEPHLILELFAGLVVIHVILYMAWSVKILWNHSRDIKESFSSLDKINLRWLRFLIVGFTITWLAALFFDMQSKGDADWDYVWLLVSLMMYLIGYMGLKQPEIFSGKIIEDLSESTEDKKKYTKSALSEDIAENYLNKLQKYIQTDKPHLNSAITLPELAQNLSMSIHHLSQIINQRLNQNFYEFINHYRVEEAKKMILDPAYKHLTIAAIGYESGFNSNSSFNSVFKKATGKTPSQYRNSAI
jgi:AraC-like DNA-binding protein